MADGSPLVSVVIPTHTRRELLARLLATLERQSLPADGYEVLIVHNHTDDGTEALARDWCARQPFAARYFRCGFNGPARSRDFGAREAQGRFIAFIDDDCIASEGWLQAGAAAFDDETVGLVQGRTTPMPGQPRPFLSKTIDIPAPTVFFETCNIFYRRSAFLAVGGFSEDFIDRFYGEDTDLGWKLTGAGFERRFAADALAHHEIFHVSLYRWLAEPLYFVNLPYLVRKYPALRQHFYRDYFVSKDSALFHLLPASLLLALAAGPLGLLLSAPYFVERYRSGGHVGRPHVRVLRALAGVPRGAFCWWALVRGSWRARTLLL